MGFPVIQSIRSCTDMEFDVHLMVENPERFISNAVSAGADFITVHQEACRHLSRTIYQVKEAGCKVGVALNPSTTVETLKYVVKDVDQVLLMTVNPGFGGQSFLPGMMGKIEDTRTFFKNMDCNPLLELDGGITVENAAECIQRGANILVAGSSVFKGNLRENIEKLKSLA